LVTNRDGPELQAATAVLFVLFLIGTTLQVLRLRTRGQQPNPNTLSPGMASSQN
jgi:hypothetical protein